MLLQGYLGVICLSNFLSRKQGLVLATENIVRRRYVVRTKEQSVCSEDFSTVSLWSVTFVNCSKLDHSSVSVELTNIKKGRAGVKVTDGDNTGAEL